MKDVIHSMRPVIKRQIRANAEAVKRYLSMNMNFCMSTSPGVKTDPTVPFHSEVLMPIDTHKLDYQFHVGYKQIVQQIGEFQRSGSGMVIDHLWHLELGTYFF